MKALFIDIDGVLNCERYIKRQPREGLIIDPKKMSLLSKIVEKTEAVLILSSSWREHWSPIEGDCDPIGIELNSIFSRYGLHIYDKTATQPREREEQIRDWLLMHPEVSSFAILDDMFLAADFLCGHFVRTSDSKGGLSAENADDCIRILNEKIPV